LSNSAHREISQQTLKSTVFTVEPIRL